MTGNPEDDRRRRFRRNVERKAARRIRARERSDSPWYWLGMLGLIGWSVTIPMLLGVALGLWLDGAVPGRISWALSLLVIGLAIGMLNAWFWVQRESADDEEETGSGEEVPEPSKEGRP